MEPNASSRVNSTRNALKTLQVTERIRVNSSCFLFPHEVIELYLISTGLLFVHTHKQRPAVGRVVYTNVRSIMNKSDELHDWVAETKPLVVGLVETWLCKNILDCEFVPEGYICFRCDRIESKRGGGVCLLIRSDIPTTQIRAFADPDGQFESVS